MKDNVFAITDTYHDSSYCFYDGDKLSHVEVERFSRTKYERLNPVLALFSIDPDAWLGKIKACGTFAVVEGDFVTPVVRELIEAKSAGASVDASTLVEQFIDACVRVTQPMAEFDGSSWCDFDPRQFRDQFHEFVGWCLAAETDLVVVGHHHAHAANAYFSTRYDRALAITLDGGGYDHLGEGAGLRREVTYGSAFACSGTRLENRFWQTERSLGAAWARITTEILGMKFGEEGTVMAMAAYGRPETFRDCFKADEPWLSHASHRSDVGAGQWQRWKDRIFADLVDEQARFDVAAALQVETEARLKELLGQLLTPDIRHICLAGGFFLNCQAIGKFWEWFPWLEGLEIPPAPYDGGLSIGAAQYVRHHINGGERSLTNKGRMPFASGRTYSSFDIVAAARSFRIPVRQAAADELAERLDAGEVGGLFMGGAESGRRALGHRSIIGDPRKADIRARLNDVIKKRKPFRPFAPMVLAEFAQDWFDLPAWMASPYMSVAVPVREHCRDRIPAVVHKDGTARIQTVHSDLTPTLHRLLTAWYEKSGVPLLLNTSFNDNEPIVQSPEHAFNCYLNAQLDFVYFADFDLIAARDATNSVVTN